MLFELAENEGSWRIKENSTSQTDYSNPLSNLAIYRGTEMQKLLTGSGIGVHGYFLWTIIRNQLDYMITIINQVILITHLISKIKS